MSCDISADSPPDTVTVVVNTSISDQVTALDKDIEAVLYSTALNGSDKFYSYYNVVITHLCKSDPKFRPDKFAFELYESSWKSVCSPPLTLGGQLHSTLYSR